MIHYSDEWLTVYAGDCRDVLPTLAADSVDCVVTSPPYWGLRDYGNDGQLGLERTPEEYVSHLVAVFREIRRVLKPSGTCWLNLGDTFSAGGRTTTNEPSDGVGQRALRPANGGPRRAPDAGLKPKDLVGIPWRVAFALQADGWYLRSDIIWSKPNPMPESVTDRPTKAHEYLFLLTKSARYYFDADAVREAPTPSTVERDAYRNGHFRGASKEADYVSIAAGDPAHRGGLNPTNPAGRNLRSVWTIATRPYADAHFAVFPPELPERCIKAGSSERGVCPECGAPWERVVERGNNRAEAMKWTTPKGESGQLPPNKVGLYNTNGQTYKRWSETLGWLPTCRHETLKPQPAVVLDPFAGSGTVGLVANRLSRKAILIDLNPEYLKQQMKRNAQTPLGLTHG